MSEKRGFTGQLHYDFDTSNNLEIKLGSGVWYRVTSRDFRSFNGPRRINNVPYSGPLYLHGTNEIVEPSEYPSLKFAGYDYRAEMTESEKFRAG